MRNLFDFCGAVVVRLCREFICTGLGFYWSPANSETIPLEPASLHAGRVYRPAVGGGDMHVQIDSRYPVTVAMTWADEWDASMQTRSRGALQFSLHEGTCHQHDLRVSSSLGTPDDYHLPR